MADAPILASWHTTQRSKPSCSSMPALQQPYEKAACTAWDIRWSTFLGLFAFSDLQREAVDIGKLGDKNGGHCAILVFIDPPNRLPDLRTKRMIHFKNIKSLIFNVFFKTYWPKFISIKALTN